MTGDDSTSLGRQTEHRLSVPKDAVILPQAVSIVADLTRAMSTASKAVFLNSTTWSKLKGWRTRRAANDSSDFQL
jgi:hypothetical protein